MSKKTQTLTRCALTGLMVFGLALLAPIAIAGGAEHEQDEPEVYRGLLISMGTVATGVNTSLNIHITDWTSATQRQIIMNALMDNTQGEESMFNIIRSQPEKGFLQVRTQPGTTRLKYAWQTVQDGKRTITLIADQLLPIMVSAGTQRLKEREYTIIHLEVDENGDGTGSAVFSASITWDDEEKKIKIGIESTEAIRITEVHRVQ